MSTPIETPMPGIKAFNDASETSLWSQAAQVVGIGLQLSGHSQVLHAHEGDAEELEIPHVQQFDGKTTLQSATDFAKEREMWDVVNMLHRESRPPLIVSACERADWRALDHPLQRSMLSWFASLTSSGAERFHRMLPPSYLNTFRSLWRICATTKWNADAAATFLQVGLRSPYMVVRSASAAQISWVEDTASDEVTAYLVEGCCSRNEAISEMSFNALRRFNPGHPLIHWLSNVSTEATEREHDRRRR